MGQRTFSSEQSTNTTVTTTTETVIATVAGVDTPQFGTPIRLTGECQFTTGTGATALTFRIRRDSVTGTVVNEANAEQIEAAAGSTESHDIVCDDSIAGEVVNQIYVLTVQQTGASADGTAVYAYLRATVG